MNTAINIVNTQRVPTRVPSSEEQLDNTITEILLTGSHSQMEHCILPIVSHFSRQQESRWVTWITAGKVSRDTLISYGINTHNIRLVQHVPQDQQAWMFWDALACGTSHTVIASPLGLHKEEEEEFKVAAELGNSQGIILRTR